ncbi:MAG: hypothetical protein ACE5KX_01530 [Acidimicrobiia bacterium]
MEDFPARIADFLEALATKVRSLTVDRLARLITWITLGFLALLLVILAGIFLTVGLLRILGELVGDIELAYAIVGGVFLLVGVLVWLRRTRRTTPEETS